MELHHLRYFVATAERSSITDAARALHVSQPAVSRAVRQLEDEIGVELLERAKQRVKVTAAGVAFLVRARQILCDMETAKQQVREAYGGERRTLRLGFVTTFLDDLVAPVMREFQQRHGGARVSLFDLTPRAQLNRLRDRELDLALLANLEGEEKEEFDVRELSRHRLALVLPSGHRLAGRKKLRLEELAGEAWVSLADSAFPGRRRFLHGLCERASFEPRIVAELESLPLMLAEVATGGGVGLLPEHAKRLPHGGCEFVLLGSPRAVVTLCLVMRRGEEGGAEQESLVALLAERAKELGD